MLPAVLVLALISVKHAMHKNNNITTIVDSILAESILFYFLFSQFFSKFVEQQRPKKKKITICSVSNFDRTPLSKLGFLFLLFDELSLCYFNISAELKSINTFLNFCFWSKFEFSNKIILWTDLTQSSFFSELTTNFSFDKFSFFLSKKKNQNIHQFEKINSRLIVQTKNKIVFKLCDNISWSNVRKKMQWYERAWSCIYSAQRFEWYWMLTGKMQWVKPNTKSTIAYTYVNTHTYTNVFFFGTL